LNKNAKPEHPQGADTNTHTERDKREESRDLER
jgi:hypothetical protein